MDAKTTEVKPGQVWADNDPRAKGRTLRVNSLVRFYGSGRPVDWEEARFAVCTVLTDREGIRKPTKGRSFWIRLDRFRPTSTGYRLIQDA